jgi:hypothetical protein
MTGTLPYTSYRAEATRLRMMSSSSSELLTPTIRVAIPRARWASPFASI